MSQEYLDKYTREEQRDWERYSRKISQVEEFERKGRKAISKELFRRLKVFHNSQNLNLTEVYKNQVKVAHRMQEQQREIMRELKHRNRLSKSQTHRRPSIVVSEVSPKLRRNTIL